jgi:hypothetical protein
MDGTRKRTDNETTDEFEEKGKELRFKLELSSNLDLLVLS